MPDPYTCCNLCGNHQGRPRDGRLGRYGQTCDECEARKGSHLLAAETGYVSRAVHG